MAESAQEAKFRFQITDTAAETLVVSFSASERISSPYEVNVSLACEDEIDFDDAVGKEALLTVESEEGERLFHGIVSRFERTGSKGRFNLYQARVVPSIWLLSLEQDCRIFQKKKADDILKQVFQDGGITGDRTDFRLQEKCPEREYCVQYRETDLRFISRLLEEEGIFYFFEHAEEKHLLVLADSTVAYQPISGGAAVPFNPAEGMVPEEECVTDFSFSRRVFSGKRTQKDFNFEKPSLDLTAKEEAKKYQKLEVFEYPGDYQDEGRGRKLTQIRLQEEMTHREKAEGKSTCPRFAPGFTFKLVDHDSEKLNQEYFLVEVRHSGAQPQVLGEQTAAGEPFTYANEFLGIPSSVPFRPERRTPKPTVEGIQSAIVAGPKGEEIYTDSYGRVKVQFHWDRLGKKNEHSSCWIRVAEGLAGGNYGLLFTPRIGQEVIVDFLEGDPDRPLLTGSVYNAENMPPYKLPDDKTKSTIKTNSSVGGDGFNEIRFEDKKGDEQIFIHAEKDVDLRVKNDRREWIGNDQHLVVQRDQKEKIEGDHHRLVVGEERKEVQADHHLKIGGKSAVEITGSSSLSVQGDVIEIFKASHNEQVSQNYYLKGMNVVIEAMTGLTIKAGGSFVTLNSGGVFIKGSMVMLNSGGAPLSGAAKAAVPPVAPLAAAVASDAGPGKDQSAQEQRHKPSQEDKAKKSWIEIELVDEDNKPVPGEKYKVTLPDGKTVAQGTLDQNGYARVNGVDPGTCKVTFPDLDKDAWEKI
jgi:type VI secretion system secreted protein VgrG